MIPKRVLLIPPAKPTSLPKQIPKPSQTDWDSPSSYTGTVKRRPPSIESPKTPILYDDDLSSDRPANVCNIENSKDDKISPPEIVRGNDIFAGKRMGSKLLSERKRHISNESPPCTISTSDQIESKPISSTLRRKSKLKLPSSSANQNCNLLPSTSTVSVIVSKSNLPKLSQARKPACADRPKYTLPLSQSVEKEKQKSNFPKALQVNKNAVATVTNTAVESKQVKNQFDNSELNKTRNKRTSRVAGTVHSRTTSLIQQDSHGFATFTELYRDFPVNYAATTVDRNAWVEPPPYCNPPSPTTASPSPIAIYKQKNVSIETQKKIRFDDGDESLQQNHHHIVVDTSVFGVDCCTQQNANDSQHHLRNKFTLSKFERSPKRSGNRSFPLTITDCETNYKKNDNREILRASANDYVMFNPTRKNFTTKMNFEKNPSSNDTVARPAFSSSVFKNLPVRPRRGIPHLENYCLFDPSTDFVNEKDNKKVAVCDDDLLEVDENEFIEEIIYDDHDGLAITSDDCDLNTYCGRVDTTSDEATTSSASQSTTETVETVTDSVIEITNANPIKENDEVNGIGQLTVSQSITNDKPTPNQSQRLSGVMHKKQNARNDKLYRHSSLPTSTSTKLIRHKCDESFQHQSNKFCENVGIENRIEVNLSPSKMTSTAEATVTVNGQKDTLKQSVSSPQLQNVLYKCATKALPIIESNYVLFYPAPVHSRNQYKIKAPRPTSTHSDADSGFLSPATPDGLTEVKFDAPVLVLQQCDSNEGLSEIYTDWANHYLERAKSKKKVADLSVDCRDGLLLAEVIEAVTTFKVPDLIKKPKNQQQMYDNVNSCLKVLAASNVGGLETVTTNDICTGRLQAVLALFFALSRYKQASKQKSAVCTSAKQQIYQNHIQQTPVVVNATSENNMTNRSLMLYGAPVWQSCANIHKKKLQTQQNKILKMMLNVPFYFRTSSLQALTKIEPITEFIESITTKFQEFCRRSPNPLVHELII